MELDTNEKGGLMEGTDALPSYTETSGQPVPAPAATRDPEVPSYNQAQSDAPPSYDSIYGRIKAMKDSSDGNADFIQKAVKVTLCSTLVLAIWSAVLLALPIAMIIMGSMKLQNCSAERYIPIYLIVWGVFGALKSLANIVGMVRDRNKDPDDEENKKARVNPFDGCISLFLCCWFIAGSYWIYHIHKSYQSTDATQANYCDQTLYLFAFWVQTVCYIVMALSIVLCCAGCVCCCCMGLFKKSEGAQ